MSDEEPAQPRRLDPELAAASAAVGAGPSSPQADSPRPSGVIDTRPYRWMIGIFGLLLVVGISVYQFAANGVGTVGVPPGKHLHYFAAPLALSTLEGDANTHPPCTVGRHDRRALNVCLLLARGPLVLAFFVVGSQTCEREVDAMQALAPRFASRGVTFAAVAVHGSHAATAKVVRARGWTIPVAYDRDGAVGTLYGIATCPLLELAHRGGVVARRLLGSHWSQKEALGAEVRRLLAGAGGRGS